MMSKPISPLLPKKSQTTQAIIAPVALTEQQTKTIQNIAIASGAMSRYNTYRSQKPESRRITPRKRGIM